MNPFARTRASRATLTLAAFAIPSVAVLSCSSGAKQMASAGSAGSGASSSSSGAVSGTSSAASSAGSTSGAGSSGASGSSSSGAAQCTGTGATGYNTYKYAYYGDLHSHTSYSLDAYSFGTRSTPSNAYLFAKGQASVSVGSATEDTAGPTITQPRPLDFLAITDHSEWLLVTHGCTVDMNSGYYSSTNCGLVQSLKPADQTTVFGEMGTLRSEILAANPDAGPAEERSAWQDIIAAANTAYAPCQFTSLVAFEWTDTKQVTDMSTNMPASATNHRNVIFANDNVPATPLDSVDYPTPPDLWTGLDSQCTAAMSCDVVTIPHNTDLSGGVSLVVWNPTPAGVAQQEHYQVSAEIYQHKAGSECYYNPDAGYADTDCQFEYPSPKSAVNIGPLSFVRTGLGSGLGYAAANTAQGNPLKLGIVGATDDHNGAPGYTNEALYTGHAGRDDDIPYKRLSSSPENGSGGLTGAWAEENTRDAIFAAIQRRETFATSGPRMSVRFYQTTDATACSDPDFPKQILDANAALPMGSTFGSATLAGASAPTFALSVWPDAVEQDLASGTMGVAGFATVQIIKVHAHITNGSPVVVEDPPNVVSGVPATGGCATWQDPAFDATEYALYYVRAIQVPTWRWSHYSCATLKANNPSNWQTLVPGCVAGGGLDVSIQERVWSSPIWFEP